MFLLNSNSFSAFEISEKKAYVLNLKIKDPFEKWNLLFIIGHCGTDN